MLTRLEVDGFKNLIDFSVEFGPYTCIAGANSTGKSNVFDAIRFLSLLADHPFTEAAAMIRESGSTHLEPHTLFYRGEKNRPAKLTIAAEMIVPRETFDDFGRSIEPSSTHLRYELTLRYEPPSGEGLAGRFGRIALEKEDLGYFKKGDASKRLKWPHNASRFRDSVIQNHRTGKAFISTSVEDGATTINVHQDGGSRGAPKKSPATNAPRTIVCTTTTADDPTIMAARREMQSWKTLALEPRAMRAPDESAARPGIGTDGSHLPATLFRLRDTFGDDILSEIASYSSALTDVTRIEVDYDPTRELVTLLGQIGKGPLLPARELSDGTLRFLALCIMLADPEYGGLVCMEEPENGIHPARIGSMVALMRDLAVDATRAPGADNPFRQVIVNTHSPAFVAMQLPDDLLLAMPILKKRDDEMLPTMRLVPMAKSWRDQEGVGISLQTISDYLTEPEDATLRLDFEVPE